MSVTVLNDEWAERERLLAVLVDGTPTDEESVKINALIANDNAFRDAYLERSEIHALLAWQFHAAGDSALARPRVSRFQFLRFSAVRWAAACVVVASLASYFLLRGESASAECEKLIRSNETPLDRAYKISAVYGKNTPEKQDDRPFDPRRAPLPTIDGAMFYIGVGDRFVLFRKYSNGEPLIVGYSGIEAWAIRGRSMVRVSSNRERFRGDIPGAEQDVPFTDMRSNLKRLQESYALELLRPQKLDAESKSESHRLRGRKRWGVRGAQSIEIFYEPSTGTIQRMIFDGMPEQNFGPVRATLELVEQREVGANWYDHSAHHEPGRGVDRVK